MMRAALILFVSAGTIGFSLMARAEQPAVALTLKDHRFAPAEITLPANQRVRIAVKNMDATPAEFESDDFSAEKVIPAGQQVMVSIPPLKPGQYEFHDEYHEAASKSRIVVK